MSGMGKYFLAWVETFLSYLFPRSNFETLFSLSLVIFLGIYVPARVKIVDPARKKEKKTCLDKIAAFYFLISHTFLPSAFGKWLFSNFLFLEKGGRHKSDNPPSGVKRRSLQKNIFFGKREGESWQKQLLVPPLPSEKRDASGKKGFLLFFAPPSLSWKFRGDRRLAAKKGETAKKSFTEISRDFYRET